MKEVAIELQEAAVVPGLPQTEEEAVAMIDEMEQSPANEWLPMEDVLDEISKRYEVYAH